MDATRTHCGPPNREAVDGLDRGKLSALDASGVAVAQGEIGPGATEDRLSGSVTQCRFDVTMSSLKPPADIRKLTLSWFTLDQRPSIALPSGLTDGMTVQAVLE